MDGYEPHDPGTPAEQQELQDLERQLFSTLAEKAEDDLQQQAAIRSLQEDCLTGNARGIKGGKIPGEAKRQIRIMARQEWENLTRQ
jgi:hypothetical protein